MSGTALPTLRTPRLTLRPLDETDADAIVDGVGNYDVSRWLGVVPYPYDRDDALKFIDQVTEGKKRVWAVCDDSGLIGTVSTNEELGYWLARPAWRKGYGFEAARAAVQHWFEDPARGDLTSGHFAGNDRSRAVLTSLGFQTVAESLRPAKSLGQDIASFETRLTRAEWNARQDFVVRTPRLVLCPLAERHAAAFAAATVPEVTRNLARVATGMSADEVRSDLPRRVWRGYPGFTLAIEHDGSFVGVVGFGDSGLGYFLVPDLWGQGLMTEALKGLLPQLFKRFPISRIVADHFEDNPASGRVLRKLGFHETGRVMQGSLARLEPAPAITYALERDKLKVLP